MYQMEDGWDFIYIQKDGVTQKTDANGKPIGDNGAISGGLGKQEIISEEYDFDGNALTFLLTSDANTEGYGYYAVISHTDIVVKDSDGNIVDFKDGLLPIENGIVTAKVNKVDIADGKALSGAKLQILDKDGRVVEEWVSDGKDHEIKGLIIGETYTLHEETAPDGYTAAADETFSIDENGEVTFLLNGSQELIRWTQTLGEDLMPFPFPNHKQVYADGEVQCDGKIFGDVRFTNDVKPLPAHQYESGTCIVCGKTDPDFKIELVDGFYQIENVAQLMWFTNKVNEGETAINAQIMADIDLTDVEFPMIGTDANMYSGTFDGQYHTVTIQLTPTNDCAGLFYKVMEGTIQNLRVAGTIETSRHLMGGIAGIVYGTTIQNCVSSVEILTSFAGDAADGGICSCADNTANRQTQIFNCVFDGKIKGENAYNSGGLVGWCYNSTLVTNCLQIGEMDIGTPLGSTDFME